MRTGNSSQPKQNQDQKQRQRHPRLPGQVNADLAPYSHKHNSHKHTKADPSTRLAGSGFLFAAPAIHLVRVRTDEEKADPSLRSGFRLQTPASLTAQVVKDLDAPNKDALALGRKLTLQTECQPTTIVGENMAKVKIVA